ncbi:hypothetical protein [Larkinella terrae]|uniref:Uncharacterized protein n=1 Tax=Larkinella terrae TaxID=2025311 RepID=A0A7K0ED86_9BACT|nr:hypothetical protein [Larkinella terrae]MRS59860.1 hypothetical protein [Larkinella terrae]
MTKEQSKSLGTVKQLVIAILLTGIVLSLIWYLSKPEASFPEVTDVKIAEAATSVARGYFITQNQPTDNNTIFKKSRVYYTIDNKSGDTTDLNVVLRFDYPPDSTFEMTYFLKPSGFNFKSVIQSGRRTVKN